MFFLHYIAVVLMTGMQLSVLGVSTELHKMDQKADRQQFVRRMKTATAEETDLPFKFDSQKLNDAILSKARPSSEVLDEVSVSRRIEEGDDDYYRWNGLPFPLRKYSLKYYQCNTMTFFTGGEGDGDDGDEGDSMFKTEKYVTFRFCPSDTCTSDGWSGCRDTYGEYILPLETFFEIQEQFEEDTYEQFCSYCETCMYFENYFYGNNRQLSSHACKYYSDCESYDNTCNAEEEGGDDKNDDYKNDDYNDDGNANRNMQKQYAINYQDLYECVPVERALETYYYQFSGYYLGITCDGEMEVSIFSDEYCTEYVADVSKLQDITGYELEIESDILGPLVSEDCFGCQESNSPYKVNYNEEAGDDLLEVCESMYTSSAKCDNKIYSIYYESETAEANAQVACNFIEDVVKGNINEYGYNKEGYGDTNLLYRVFHNDIVLSTAQSSLLFITMMGCAIMSILAVHYRKQIKNASVPILKTNEYPSESDTYTKGENSTYESRTTYGSPKSSGSAQSTDPNFDPVSAARSID